MIDRMAPAQRPLGRAAGNQNWRSLLFMHWPVPAEAMRTVVPKELTLDLYEDVCYVGIVPFQMQGVRPRWLPAAGAFNFLETNLRTYVLAGEEPGIYFFSLEAASRLAVWAARVGWGLPYYYAQMSMNRRGEEIVYETQRPRKGARHFVRYTVGDGLPASQSGTLQHFLLERYFLFVKRGEDVFRGQVHHIPYPAHQAKVLEVEDELAAAAGLPAVEGLPEIVHYSPGVDVEMFGLSRVGG